jgi:putative oxidoreductase
LENYMAKVDSRWRGWAPRLLSVLRIVAAFLLMEHGGQKLFGFLGGIPGGAPPVFRQLWIAGVLEFFGGLLLLLGLFTRPVAFILSGMLAVAYFQVHWPRGFWPVLNRGELPALYCFVFLYLSSAGGGPWSLDSVWRRVKI